MTGAPYRDGLGSAEAPEPCGLGRSGAIPSAAHTPGPWFGPNYNSATAEPTHALTGKFKPRGHKSRTDYSLRIEVTGDNVFADARLVAAAPELFEALEQMVAEKRDYMLINKLGNPDEQHTIKAAQAALAKARAQQVQP